MREHTSIVAPKEALYVCAHVHVQDLCSAGLTVSFSLPTYLHVRVICTATA